MTNDITRFEDPYYTEDQLREMVKTQLKSTMQDFFEAVAEMPMELRAELFAVEDDSLNPDQDT